MSLIEPAPPPPSAPAEGGAGNAGHLRRLNLERMLGAIMEEPRSFTRAELIKATRLSAPTVGSLVSHLMRSGIVRDLGTGPSRGGRRPALMEFNARHGFVAGVDLGPTKTRLALADLRGARLAHRVLPTPVGVPPVVLLQELATAMRGVMKEAGVPPPRLLAVGAGAPGVVDPRRGMVLRASNLPGWTNVPMAAILKKALGAPIVVENDVNLAILGERWRGAARGHETCAFISAGKGIGAGIVLEGKLHRGHHLLAGEIGFMCMGPQFVKRDFGPLGCLEALAGLRALAAHWPRTARSGLEQWVSDLFEAAEAGDRRARKAVDVAATLVGMATANLALVLDPSLVVLGGALATQGGALVREVRKIVGRIMPAPPEIVVSPLGKEAPLWGTLLVALTEAKEGLRQGLRQVRVSA
jgi:glucokinase